MTAAAPSSALELCGWPQRALRATQGVRADTVRKSRDSSADAVFTQELMARPSPPDMLARQNSDFQSQNANESVAEEP